MSVLVRCPNPACGRTASAADTHLGRRVRCRHCGTAFTCAAAGDGPGPAEALRTVPPQSRETLGGPLPSAPTFHPPVFPGEGPAGQPFQVSRFQVRARLGAGAFGTVYRAYDPQLDREVALKVPHPGTLESPTAVERFLREAKAAARLRHPHIVPVYEAGCDGTHHYIATAFIEGCTLAQAVEERRLDFRQAAEVVRELAEALAYAHSQGVVHRDVKPSNVMLDTSGAAYLMDFGLAHQQGAGTQLTQQGGVLGTPAYMAPEQAEGRAGPPLPASDQYSLGALLYHLLCGELPFSGTPYLVLYKLLHEAPPAPGAVEPGVPPRLEAICLKAMAKKADDRYPSMKEFAAALADYLRSESPRADVALPPQSSAGPGTGPREPGRSVVGRPVGGRGRRRKWVLSAAALLVLAAGGAALALGLEGARQSRAEALRLEEQARARDEELRVAALRREADDADRRREEEQARAGEDRRKREQEAADRHKREEAEAARLREKAAEAARLREKQQEVVRRRQEQARAEAERRKREQEAAERQKREQEAEAARLREKQQEQIRAALDQGTGALGKRDYDLAIRCFGEALRLDPRSAPALAHRAGAHARKRDFDAAFADADAALRLDPNLAVACAYRGWARATRRTEPEDEQALADSEKALKLGPPLAPAYHARGLVYLHRKEHDRALAAFDKALQLDPDLAPSHDGRGHAYSGLKDYDRAVEEFSDTIRLEPTAAVCRVNRAVAYGNKGDYDRAITDCGEAIRLDPRNARAFATRGNCYRMKGEYDTAIADLTEAARLDPKSPYVFGVRSECYRMKKEHDKAIADCCEAIRLDPKYAFAFGVRGASYRTKGERDRAITDLTEAIRLDPQYAFAFRTRGGCYGQSGEYDKAIADLTRATRLDPNYAPAYHALAVALQAEGRWAEAAGATRRRLELLPPSHPTRSAATGLLRHCERMLALEARLPAVLQGKEKPASPSEEIEFAGLCRVKKRYAAAAHFYAKAFAADAKLAADLRRQHRYHAACCAALAGTGQGAAPPKSPDDRKGLRRQALRWLKADVAAWAKVTDRDRVRRTLTRWQQTADLAGVRDRPRLAPLPTVERAEWVQLWAEVAALGKSDAALGPDGQRERVVTPAAGGLKRPRP